MTSSRSISSTRWPQIGPSLCQPSAFVGQADRMDRIPLAQLRAPGDLERTNIIAWYSFGHEGKDTFRCIHRLFGQFFDPHHAVRG